MLLHQGLCLNLAVTWTSKPLEETQPGLFYTEFCKIRHLQFRVEGLNISWFGRTLSFINIQIQIQWNANQNYLKMNQVLLPGLLTGLHLQTANGLPSMLIYSFKVSCDLREKSYDSNLFLRSLLKWKRVASRKRWHLRVHKVNDKFSYIPKTFSSPNYQNFSSSISIVPDTFPVEECFGEECMAGLVWVFNFFEKWW